MAALGNWPRVNKWKLDPEMTEEIMVSGKGEILKDIMLSTLSGIQLTLAASGHFHTQ